MNVDRYQRPDTHGGTMRTPVQFLEKVAKKPFPGEYEEEELFFTMANVYSSSVADYQTSGTTSSESMVTLIFNYPRNSGLHTGNTFKILDGIFKDNTYEIHSITSVYRDLEKVKVVGIKYG